MNKRLCFLYNHGIFYVDYSLPISAVELESLIRKILFIDKEKLLRVYSYKRTRVHISQYMKCNSKEEPYFLETLDPSELHFQYCEFSFLKKSYLNVATSAVVEHINCLQTLQYSPNEMKKKFLSHTSSDSSTNAMSKFDQEEDVSLVTVKNETIRCASLSCPVMSVMRKTEVECRHVWEQFTLLCTKGVTEEVRLALRNPSFDNWQWDDPALLLLLRQMFLDLDLLPLVGADCELLARWLLEVYRRYNHVPFHNFKHCFMVSQMMYALIWQARLETVLEKLDLLVLLVSSVCHDLDHPGYNNAYQINAGTSLAIRYNDLSPLENHHCAQAFYILLRDECNLFRYTAPQDFKKIREAIISCILATDMARHSEILGNFNKVLPVFQLNNPEHKTLLLMILIKVSDISNEARPMECAEPWLDCLLEEFFNQSDTEKEQGLPVAPFMDRDKVTKASSQCGFIKFVILPLFEALAKLFPSLQEPLVTPVRNQLEIYAEKQRLSMSSPVVQPSSCNNEVAAASSTALCSDN